MRTYVWGGGTGCRGEKLKVFRNDSGCLFFADALFASFLMASYWFTPLTVIPPPPLMITCGAVGWYIAWINLDERRVEKGGQKRVSSSLGFAPTTPIWESRNKPPFPP